MPSAARSGVLLLLLAIAIAGVAVFTAFLGGNAPVVWALLGALALVLVVQLGIVVRAARERRRLARGIVIATLVVTLLVNPLTVGGVRGIVDPSGPFGLSGLSGLFGAAGGSEAGSGGSGGARDADIDPIWKGYPGSRFTPVKDVVDGADLATFAERSDAMLAELRAALTAEFGFEWIERQPAKTEKDGNGFGGDSMLNRYTAPVWQTTKALTDIGQKNRAVEIIRQVAQRYGIVNLSMQNAPAAWRQPGELTDQFGGETLETQALWSLNAYDAIAAGGRFSTDIVDLSIDATGKVEKNRYFDITSLGMAPDGIELHLDASALLAEADRAAFLAALKPFDGLTVPQ